MEFATFVALVTQCREAQKAYLRRRVPSTLAIARDYERRVDAALEQIEREWMPDLFQDQ